MTRSPFTAWRREDLSPRELKIAELCIHESAHSVVGLILGGRLKVALVSGGNTGGKIIPRTTFTHSPAGWDAQIAFAGAYAQSRWRAGNVPPPQGMVYQVLAGGGDYAMLAAAGGTSAGAPVIPLVERCWPAICTLADRIASNITVGHDDVCEAKGLSADPATAAHELALIRSGCVPGSFIVTPPTTTGV